MKKTSTRLASLGGLVVLGACAIALAQHDSRNREREPKRPAEFVHRDDEPIQVPGDWPKRSMTTAAFPGTSPSADASSRYTALSVLTPDTPESQVAQASLSDDEDQLAGEYSLPPSLPANDSGASISDGYSPPALPANDSGASISDGYSPPALPAIENDYLEQSDSVSASLVAAQAPVGQPNSPPPWLQGGGGSSPKPGGDAGVGAQPEASSAPALPSLPVPGQTATATMPYQADALTPPTAAPLSKVNQQLGSRSGRLSDGPSPAGQSGAVVRELAQASQSATSSLPEAPAFGSAAESSSAQDLRSSARLGRPSPTSLSANESAASESKPAQVNALRNPSGLPQAARNVSEMSDTQRAAMQATDMTQPEAAFAGPSTPPAYGAPQRAPGRNLQQHPSAGPPFRSNGSYSPTELAAPERKPIGASTGAAYASDSRVSRANTTETGASYQAGSAGGAPVSSSAPVYRLAQLSSNRPGNRFLDGAQNPVLLIQKRAPEEIQVGKRATFVIEVENAGKATAHDVKVVDRVPQGVRFVESTPQATSGQEGMLSWDLGKLSPGEKRTLTLQVVPEVQGEIGSVASVQFAAQAALRTIATLPKLELEVQSASDVLLGDSERIVVTVRNTGTGVARSVVLEADVPKHLRYQSGDAHLKANVGDLRPSEARTVELPCAAVLAGESECLFRAVALDGIKAESQRMIEVLSPKFTAAIAGPKVRYLGREATYRVAVRNVGTASATNIEFLARLPAGLQFKSVDAHGSYDPNSHTVTWRLHELPVGQPAPIEVTVLPVELGQQVLSFRAVADLGIEVEAKSEVAVKGLSELAFSVGQDNGTIEVGSMSTYSVQVANIGNDSDRSVQLLVELPKGATLDSVVSAPVQHRASGNTIVFAPITELRQKDQYTFRFRVKHGAAGRQIVRSKLTSETWPQAVVKEEGTLVYNDQN